MNKILILPLFFLTACYQQQTIVNNLDEVSSMTNQNIESHNTSSDVNTVENRAILLKSILLQIQIMNNQAVVETEGKAYWGEPSSSMGKSPKKPWYSVQFINGYLEISFDKDNYSSKKWDNTFICIHGTDSRHRKNLFLTNKDFEQLNLQFTEVKKQEYKDEHGKIANIVYRYYYINKKNPAIKLIFTVYLDDYNKNNSYPNFFDSIAIANSDRYSESN